MKVLALGMVEKRVKAIIANSPIYDAAAVMRADMPQALQKAPAFIGDAIIKVATSIKPFTKVALERIFWTAGVDNTSDMLKLLEDYVTDPAQITVPFLAMYGEGEPEVQHRQAHIAYEQAATTKKHIRMFTTAEGADAHVQLNNFSLLQQVVYDWLDDVLK